jgi:hypothetical protein
MKKSQLSPEIKKQIKAEKKAIWEVKHTLNLHNFRSAACAGQSVLFNENGEFSHYGFDSGYKIQYQLNPDMKTKKELIEKIKENIEFLNDYKQ